MTIITRPEWG